MNSEPTVNCCPKCQAPLPSSAPQGLCPKCLLAAAVLPTDAGQPVPAGTAPPALETVAGAFPQLEILELIGSGGMGVVYKARQPRLDRVVALKLLPQALAAAPAFAERFHREARLLARLNHPAIVTVHDFGQSGGFFYLLMEFVDGVNLRQAMQGGRFTPPQALALVPKICEALQYAHDEGILHRDIKPENILLDARGRVKIADFGIAKLLGDKTPEVTLTARGAALGTPHYMAPEQLEHPQDVDQRADIYSLGGRLLRNCSPASCPSAASRRRPRNRRWMHAWTTWFVARWKKSARSGSAAPAKCRPASRPSPPTLHPGRPSPPPSSGPRARHPRAKPPASRCRSRCPGRRALVQTSAGGGGLGGAEFPRRRGGVRRLLHD